MDTDQDHNGGGVPAGVQQQADYGPGALCDQCGYDLHGLSTSQPCPECNARPLWPAWGDRPLPDWCVCTHCGYGVAGLSGGDRCPECTAPAVWSLQGWRLRFSHPRVLRSMARGSRMVFWGVILLVTVPVVSVAVLMLSQLSNKFNSNTPAIVFSLLFLLGYIVACAMVLGGWWRLTTPDASGRRPRSGLWTRIGVVMMLVSIGALGVTVFFAAQGQGVATPLIGVGVMSVGYLIFLFASLFYLRGLAWRLRNQSLQSYATVCLVLCPVLSILGGCIYGLGNFAAIVLYLILIGWSGKAIRAEAARAQHLNHLANVHLGAVGAHSTD